MDQTTKSDVVNEGVAITPLTRKPYQSPQVINLGAVHSIVSAANECFGDGSSAQGITS